ncbi:amino acid adenylation domain-containing protein [Streptomyces sp. Marseille-Q5077]|uniref:non-ribosomal peptide synthetase n=1 Tax=Streptomyces sp. Marseille-Q5077 TaxID=3418995 RepID=UPI003CFFF8C4
MNDDTQRVLRELFAVVLGVARVGERDSFFDLGGDSLSAMRLVHRARTALGAELSLRDLFDAPTPAALGDVLDRMGTGTQAPAPVGSAHGDRAPLTFAQHGVWFLEQLDGNNADFNLPLAIRLTGALDRGALRAAVDDVVGRHEALRTLCLDVDGVPAQQVVEARAGFQFERVEQSALPERLAHLASYSFDPGREIPLRTWLLQIAPQDHVLLLLTRQMAVDETSLGLLTRDLGTAYGARVRHEGPQWPQPTVRYTDFAHRQRASADAGPGSTRVQERVKALMGMPDELGLPYDRPRPALPSRRGEQVRFHVGADVHRRLADLARARNSTLFMVAQSAVAVLLNKLGGGDDIPLGTRAELRPDAALEELVGLCANHLVLRTDVSGDPTFEELVARVRGVNLDACSGLDVPFERLVEEVNPPRSLSRYPLFQTLVTLRSGADPVRLPGLEARPYELALGVIRHDLTIDFVDRRTQDGTPDGIAVRVGYSCDLFDRETAQDLGDRLLRVLMAVAEDPQRRLSRIDVLDPAERHRLVVEWNNTAFPVPRRTLPDMLEAQAEHTPDLPAVQMGEEVLSYAELNSRANQLARHLISHGVGPETVVALMMPRSVDVIVSLWATLKAGGAYLPIDPSYPAERVAYMQQDAAPVLKLTKPVDVRHLPETNLTDAERLQSLRPEHPAYVMYTSGSTGRPKAVVMPGASLVSLLTWYKTNLTPGRMALFSSLSFDTSAFEVLVATTTGGCLVVPPEEVRHDVDLFAQWLADYDVHDMNLPNLVLDALCEVAERTGIELPELRMIAQGGEALTLSPRLKSFFAPSRRRLDNYYGPTETHLAIAQSFPTAVADWPDEPLLGRPIGNMRGYVLDEWLQPVPVGVVGELYLAGEQLSRGYLNRPSATAARFVANPFDGSGSRMYRTGDLVRRRKDGHLLFLGRVDHQVKIRGFRIELGEIETVLRRHPGVARAAVLAVEDRPGSKRLVAYVVSENGPVDVDALRAHVAETLPDYMVPWAYVQLDEMPLTPNRKLDRKALPKPADRTMRRAPRTAVETSLCEIYADVLAAPEVSIDDNFFELGGSSLTAVQLVGRVRAALGLGLPLRLLFEQPTPAALAKNLSDSSAPATRAVPVSQKPREVPDDEEPDPKSRTQLLCELFADVLERDTVSADDNFFALGGHSLLATRLANRIRDDFGAEVLLSALFEHPTPAGVDRLLDSSRAARPALRPVAKRDG